MPRKAPHPLLDSLDRVIEKHKSTNPDLQKDLLAYRAGLEQLLEQGRNREAARLALQIASWIKFFYDLLE